MQVSPEKVKHFRKENGWSQEVLAKASGLSLRTIQRVEKDGNSSSETQLALAAAFNKSAKELFFVSNKIETNWKWRNIMQSFLALIVVVAAVLMLLVLGGDLGMFADVYGILFLLLFMYSCTVVAYGFYGLRQSIIGLRYLFSSDIKHSPASEFISVIIQKQVSFIYGGALIATLVGSIAILSSSDALASHVVFLNAFAVNLLVLLYASIIAEGILRPLSAKLTLQQHITHNS